MKPLSGMRRLVAWIHKVPKHLLVWGFKHLYEDWAGAYDAVAGAASLGRWYEWVTLTMPYLCGPRVLEVGPGTGHLLANLRNGERLHPFGADRSLKMLRLAQARAGKQVPLMRCEAKTLPVTSATFDSIVSTFPAEFIRESVALSEFRRALRPGGKLIILPLAVLSGGSVVEKFAAWALAFIGSTPRNPLRALEDTLLPMLREQYKETVLHELRPPGSRVFVIVATKAQDHP